MRKRKLIEVSCKHCGKIILKEKRCVRENKKLGHNFYCSRECQNLEHTKIKTLICENCNKELSRAPNAISPHNYCSQSCAAIANNKKRPDRNGRITICKNCGKPFKWQVGNKKYCSMKCRRIYEGWTKKEIIETISKMAKRLNRVPAKRELRKVDSACRRIFGSWNNAISAAGFSPNRSHNNRMYKRNIAKAADGHFCDSVSELIIDNWLYKNNIIHKRNASYPDTNHKSDWSLIFRNQIIFIEYFGLAKDSPRYDRCIARKKLICNKNKIDLIEIYPDDLYPQNKLNSKLKFLLS